MLLPIFRQWVIVFQTCMAEIKWCDSGFILKVDLVLSFDKCDIEYERMIGLNNDFKDFVL